MFDTWLMMYELGPRRSINKDQAWWPWQLRIKCYRSYVSLHIWWLSLDIKEQIEEALGFF